jgi:hypothetical protein
MRTRIHRSIDEIDPAQWNRLAGAHLPFLRHELLAALEHSRSVGGRTGWEPAYVALHDEHGVAAAAPAFVKSHSWGEFVFDFGWAQAYSRAGLDYYPKLVLASPFTPATGARLLVRPGLERESMSRALLAAIAEFAREAELSSVHALFIDETERRHFAAAGWLARRDCQFHWTNAGYASFEDYLATFTAEKRKKVKRERRRVTEAGIVFETLHGGDLDAATLDRVYAFHRDTFLRHGNEPYLTRAFFTEIARKLPEALMVKLARAGRAPVAAAIFWAHEEALFGRYWGANADYHSLHFEACYHQGIDYCIERGIARFEPGTQGEHKVARGFAPALTWSAHHIPDARFRGAIGEYLVREADAVDAYAQSVQAHVPYRRRG